MISRLKTAYDKEIIAKLMSKLNALKLFIAN